MFARPRLHQKASVKKGSEPTMIQIPVPVYRTFVLDWHSLKKGIYLGAFTPLAQGSSQLFSALLTAFPNP